MLIQHFFTPGLSINSFLVYDDVAKVGALIDPTRNFEPYISFASQEGIEITDILETHVHADFLSGAIELKQALDNKPKIHCSGMGGKEWIPTYADHVVKDREEIVLGSLRFQAWHTPGHTPEHVIWIVFDNRRSQTIPEVAFTGDLVFVGSVGRPDLLGVGAEKELARLLYQSLFETIQSLPDFVEIYPSHGAGSLCGKGIGRQVSSNLGYEKRTNPGMLHAEYNKWLERLHQGMPSAPQYFSMMKKLNLTGPKPQQHEEMPLVLIKEQVDRALNDNLVIDIRNPLGYSAGNFKGSLNIPYGPSFIQWCGSVIPYDKPLLLVVDHASQVVPALQAMRLIGLDHVTGFIALENWDESDRLRYLQETPQLEVATLSKNQKDYYILDVRTPREWDEGHIEGAHSLELTEVSRNMKTIPTDKTIAVVCHSGNRASIIASLLAQQPGVKAVNVKGGMQAWYQKG